MNFPAIHKQMLNFYFSRLPFWSIINRNHGVAPVIIRLLKANSGQKYRALLQGNFSVYLCLIEFIVYLSG